MKAKVFYWKSPDFLINPEKINRWNFWKHYKKLPREFFVDKETVKSGKDIIELEKIFSALNLFPSCFISKEDIEKLGLSHTSMSVGDIVKVGLFRYYICMPVGWRRLSFLTMKLKGGEN